MTVGVDDDMSELAHYAVELHGLSERLAGRRPVRQGTAHGVAQAQKCLHADGTFAVRVLVAAERYERI